MIALRGPAPQAAPAHAPCGSCKRLLAGPGPSNLSRSVRGRDRNRHRRSIETAWRHSNTLYLALGRRTSTSASVPGRLSLAGAPRVARSVPDRSLADPMILGGPKHDARGAGLAGANRAANRMNAGFGAMQQRYSPGRAVPAPITGKHRSGQAVRRCSRTQSKPGPGSLLRPGAMCS